MMDDDFVEKLSKSASRFREQQAALEELNALGKRMRSEKDFSADTLVAYMDKINHCIDYLDEDGFDEKFVLSLRDLRELFDYAYKGLIFDMIIASAKKQVKENQ